MAPGPDLPALVQTVLYHRDPLAVLLRARARYGPVFSLNFTFSGPLTFVAAPELVPRVLEAGGAGGARRAVLPVASPQSVFGAGDSQHRAIRTIMEPAFHLDEAAAEAIARTHVETWPARAPFRLLPRMRTLATDIFVSEVLRAPKRRRALTAAIRRLLLTPGNPPLPIPDSRPTDALFRRRMAPLARELDAEISERRAAGRTGPDLIGRLMEAMPREEIVDRLLVVIAAAQEPPSIALTNVAYELARRPELQDRFPAEHDAIVHETLRLRPSAQAVLRTLDEPLSVAGRTLPAGTPVALSTLLLHRDPDAFPDPHAFKPERFANGEPDRAPYIPFGGGARRCIGEPVARTELRAVLPVVFQRRRLRAVWPRAERMVVRGTVLVPHRSALVTTFA